ncbi:hypothetical protein JCM15519_17580 [Fundidesulfovibrio butyratiphilus]
MKKSINRTFLLADLTWATLFPALLARLFRYRVLYMYPAESMQRTRLLRLLRGLGISPVDFHGIGPVDEYDPMRLEGLQAGRRIEELGEPFLRSLAPLFRLSPAQTDKLRALLFSLFTNTMRFQAPVWTVARYLRNQGQTVAVFLPIGLIERWLSPREDAGIPNRCPLIWPTCGFAFSALCAVGRKARNVFRKKAPPSAPEPTRKTSPVDPAAYEVLFFTHHGCAYGKLYQLDYFYSPDRQSPFFPEKILHVERLETLPPESAESIRQGFVQRGLTFYPLALGWTGLPTMALRFLKSWRRARLTSGNAAVPLGAMAAVGIAYLLYERAYGALGVFSKAKLALIAYDYLFPLEMSLALHTRGIRTAAVQERFIQGFYPNLALLLDEYFVWGERSRRCIEKTTTCAIERITPIGPVRADTLWQKLQEPLPERIAQIKNNRQHVVLVLDWHSTPDEYSNAALWETTWKNNRLFYSDILRLAAEFPQAHFIIRGKNDNWTRLPYFRDTLDRITKAPNIEISADYSQYNVSYDLAAVADSIIARHTSLGDEAIALGKPVLFYEVGLNCPRCVASVFDYDGHPVFFFTYEELRKQFQGVLEGRLPELAAMRQEYYANPSGTVRAKLQEELQGVLSRAATNRATADRTR